MGTSKNARLGAALAAALMIIPAAFYASAQSGADIHSYYIITDLGNFFQIKPPPPPLAPDFDTSPYLERHDANGLVAIMYPNTPGHKAVYELRGMGSNVDLPEIGDRPSATVAIIDQDAWNEARAKDPPFPLSASPLAGNIRLADDRIIHGLMKPRITNDLFDNNWCDGTENTHCIHLSGSGQGVCGQSGDGNNYKCTYLNSTTTMSDGSGWPYLEIPPIGVTIIELRGMPAGINFVCPGCKGQIYAYAGLQASPSLWSQEVTRYTNSITFSDIDSSAPPSFPRPTLHPNLKDVSTVVAKATNSIIALNITDAVNTGTPFCRLTSGDDIDVAISGSTFTISVSIHVIRACFSLRMS